MDCVPSIPFLVQLTESLETKDLQKAHCYVIIPYMSTGCAPTELLISNAVLKK
jgi:hypothetical protein